MKILEDVEEILLTEIAMDLGRESLDPDEDLLAQRVIDSLGVVRLIVSLEKAFGIEVIDEEIVPENFQSLNSLVEYIEQKIEMSRSH
jgi:acyl carrier protein